VILQQIGGAALTAAQSAWSDTLTRDRLPVALGQTDPVEAGACNFPYCDAPLRAGLWLNLGSTSSPYCSTGFNVFSQTDGAPYVVTAGHCNSHLWYEKQATDGAFHRVGITHSLVFNTTGDEQLVNIENPAGWQELNPYVYVTDSFSTGYPTVLDETYDITGDGTGYAGGEYLCHTGATDGTHCGQVTASNVTITYDNVTVHGLVRLHGQSCQGDSGGPVFVSHHAFGIYVAYSVSNTYTQTGPDGVAHECSPDSWYIVPIATIEASLHVFTFGH
jgi:hypothetical protein